MRDKLDTEALLVLMVLELVGIALVVHLWRKRQTSTFSRIVWSVVLLIPFLGPILYLFVRNHPKGHGEDPGDTIGASGVLGDVD